jgi:hypothetical protein
VLCAGGAGWPGQCARASALAPVLPGLAWLERLTQRGREHLDVGEVSLSLRHLGVRTWGWLGAAKRKLAAGSSWPGQYQCAGAYFVPRRLSCSSWPVAAAPPPWPGALPSLRVKQGRSPYARVKWRLRVGPCSWCSWHLLVLGSLACRSRSDRHDKVLCPSRSTRAAHLDVDEHRHGIGLHLPGAGPLPGWELAETGQLVGTGDWLAMMSRSIPVPPVGLVLERVKGEGLPIHPRRPTCGP